MCAGEFSPNQKLAFSQPGRVSVNLLSESLAFLIALHKNTDESSIAMVQVVVQTLREILQGDLENQREAMDRKIIEPIHHIFFVLVSF